MEDYIKVTFYGKENSTIEEIFLLNKAP